MSPPSWDVWITTNEDGRRDHNRAPNHGEKVVLGLGDSQAFGWGVNLAETFFTRVEVACDCRVIKAGIPGTGPSDYAENLQVIAADIKPDAVVVSIFVGNDFSDAAREGADQYAVDGGLLVRREAVGATAWQTLRDWAARRSHLLQALRAWQFNLTRGSNADPRGRVWDAWMREFAAAHLRSAGPLVERGYQETRQALDRMRSHAETLIVVAIPRSWQIDRAERDEMMAAMGVSPTELDLDRPQRFLREWCEANDVLFVDPLVRMRSLSVREQRRLYFTPDAHMTPRGHAVVAEVLAPAVAGSLAR